MGLVRFLFGHGWWIALYLAMYAWWLVSVVIWLVMFGREVKAPGAPVATPSPGSIMVLMIAVGLAASTLATLSLALCVRWSVPLGLLVGFLASVGVLVGVGYLNLQLAEVQSRGWFNANLVVSGLIVVLNLLALWIATERPGPPPLPVAIGP